MQKNLIVVEIGSTYTKATAFILFEGVVSKLLGKGYALTTVKQGDVTIGLNDALKDLSLRTGIQLTQDTIILGNSSAAGGLKMTVHGLVPEMTAKAGKEAALGAGAVVKLVTSGKIKAEDKKRIEEISPNLLLLAGGVDYGESEIILENARVLSTLKNPIPIIYAGNLAIREEVAQIFQARGHKVYLTENVYPRLDELNIEPVKKIIQQAFEEHITEGPGMSQIRKYLSGHLLPTPGAVMKAFQLLSRVVGHILGFDVGGATTDVHSVTEGDEELKKITPYPEPIAKRTVEGDLGVYLSARGVVELFDGLEKEKISEELVSLTPQANNPQEMQLTSKITRKAVETALFRHVGEIRHVVSPSGRGTYVWGKDLTKIKWVVGTGGALIFLPGMDIFLKSLFNRPASRWLLPVNPEVFLDRKYLLSSIGTLASQKDIDQEALVKFTLNELIVTTAS